MGNCISNYFHEPEPCLDQAKDNNKMSLEILRKKLDKIVINNTHNGTLDNTCIDDEWSDED